MIDFQKFKDKTFYITGSTGLIGAALVKRLMQLSNDNNLNIKIYATCRDIAKFNNIFNDYANLIPVVNDVTTYDCNDFDEIDYVVHLANGTSSNDMLSHPIETYDTIVNDTRNVLEFSKNHHVKSCVYTSTLEVYGTNNDDKTISETDYNGVDVLNLRNSYPIAKQSAEFLCKAYAEQQNVLVKILRLCQVIAKNDYDYTNDNRLPYYLARCVKNNEDIVLSTDGTTSRVYCALDDAVDAILFALTSCKNGEAYNVCNNDYISVNELAQKFILVFNSSSKLVHNIDAANSSKYFQTKLNMSNEKLSKLGFKFKYDIESIIKNLKPIN